MLRIITFVVTSRQLHNTREQLRFPFQTFDVQTSQPLHNLFGGSARKEGEGAKAEKNLFETKKSGDNGPPRDLNIV